MRKIILIGMSDGKPVTIKELVEIVAEMEKKSSEKIGEGEIPKEKEDVEPIMLDLDSMNHINDFLIKRKIRWEENATITEWKRKPENIKKMSDASMLLFMKYGKEWTSLKTIVNDGFFEGKYNNCREILDLLYAVGFVAIQEEGNHRMYRIIPDPFEKLSYINDTIDVWTSNINDLIELKKGVMEEAGQYKLQQLQILRESVKKEIDKLSKEELLTYVKDNKIPIHPTAKWGIETIRTKIIETIK